MPVSTTADDVGQRDSVQTARLRKIFFHLASRGRHESLLRALQQESVHQDDRLREIMVDHDQQKTLLHAILQSQFYAINKGAANAVVRGYDHVLNLLLRHPSMNASLYCPLVDAVHYRLIAAQSSLIRHTRNQRGLKRCLSELDTNGENVLHIASKSKASGFARYFLAAHELSSSRGSNNDEFVNVSSKSVFTSSSRENAGALSFGRLNSASAIGAADLVALLRAGVDAGLGVDWLSHRSTGPLESPLLAGCRGGREEVVRILLDGLKQFRVSSVRNIQTDGHWNMTCAHVAAARGHISVLNLLFVQDDAQQMMSWQDVFGRDPAHVACAAGRVEASKLMIQRNYIDAQKCKEIAAKPGLRRSAEDVAVFSCAISKESTPLSACLPG